MRVNVAPGVFRGRLPVSAHLKQNSFRIADDSLRIVGFTAHR